MRCLNLGADFEHVVMILQRSVCCAELKWGSMTYFPFFLESFKISEIKPRSRELSPVHALLAEYLWELNTSTEKFVLLLLHLCADEPFLYGSVGCRHASLQPQVIEFWFPCWVKFEERTTLHSFHCPFYFFFKYKEVNVKFCKSTVKKSQVFFNMFTCPGCSQPEDLEIQFCSQIETIFQFRSWFKYWQYDIFISLFVSENA